MKMDYVPEDQENMTNKIITIQGIIDGIDSPYGEGAEYRYQPEHYYGASHLDDEGKKNLTNDLKLLINQVVQAERERIQIIILGAIVKIVYEYKLSHEVISKFNKMTVKNIQKKAND